MVPQKIILEDPSIQILRLVREAEVLAIKNIGVNENSFHVGALLLNESFQRIGAGVNNMRKTHRRLLDYYPYPFLHAESAAIIKSGLRYIENGTLIVVRVGVKGRRRLNSRPCEYCQQFAYDHGIRRAIYIDENGKIVKMKIENLGKNLKNLIRLGERSCV